MLKRHLINLIAAGATAIVGLAVAAVATTAAATTTAATTASNANAFVVRKGASLRLNNAPFTFAGSNNYYLMYKSTTMVDDVFADAKAAGLTVLRTWGFLDIGNADGSNSVRGPQEGVYFQYWDGDSPAYNDGPNGLARLDYVVYAAKQAGVRLVIPLTNNWNDFGGMDQYVRWRGGSFHDEFYTDPVIRGWYKDWISHVLNRVNTLTGVAYKDEPAIMMWELGNEPRCLSAGAYPRSPNCTTQTLVDWADEMTRHIKSIDANHLAGVGDEGFFCDSPTSTDWTTNCGEGVDSLAFTRLPAVDVMSFHLYPDAWGKAADPEWADQWITRHVQEARRIGKPVMLGEFGWLDKSTRNPTYARWTQLVDKAGGTGWLYWILSGIQDDGTLYPDFDGFTVYCPSPVCTTLSNASEELTGAERSRPPVADHDTAVTPANTAVAVTPAANDIGYRTKVRPTSIDLDPATAGQQTSLGVTGGVFELRGDGSVLLTPAQGFAGRAIAHYTIRDQAGRTSNVADITVTVLPDPTAAVVLADWEDGVEGWAPGNWQPDAGTVAQTTDYHTNGSAGLHVVSNGGAWFGVAFPQPVDLTGKVTLKYDVRTGPAGTSANVALQVGEDWTWCQGTWSWVPENQDTTVEIDLLTSVNCEQGLVFADELHEIRGMFIWISPGEFALDHVRAE
jgi:mannan endo-1,4-beta-mannosidase